MFSFASKLYPLTDTQLSRLSHAAQVMQLTEGGARLIQLRDKHLSPRELLPKFEAALSAASVSEARIIINDRVDIALALGAAGVHLGQDDLPPVAARKLLGPEAIIGFSTHSLKQAKLAVQLPVSYIAIGPIFPTSSKTDSENVVGLEGLRQVRDVVGDMPLVAIGGITLENAATVIDAGADAVAVISALFAEHSAISNNVKRFLDLLQSASAV
jgi:thiamine-phosphate pyrophosphorylase